MTRMIASLYAISLLVIAGVVAAEDPPESPWSGSGELSFVSTSGNTDTESLGLGFDLVYEPGVWTTELELGFIRSESDGEVTAEKLTGRLGVRRSLSTRLDAYARTTYLKNEFAGVNSTWSLEAGGLYKVLTGERHFFDVSAGLGYTTENRVSEEDLDFAMATIGAVYKWKISESTELINDLGFVYDLDNSDDWRIANETSLATAINSIFSLKVSHALNDQNDPSAGFEKRDTVTSAALVARF